jgi:hypothetical protein
VDQKFGLTRLSVIFPHIGRLGRVQGIELLLNRLSFGFADAGRLAIWHARQPGIPGGSTLSRIVDTDLASWLTPQAAADPPAETRWLTRCTTPQGLHVASPATGGDGAVDSLALIPGRVFGIYPGRSA